ncbi:hypothetical protein POX_c04582 [Penicillium oxalicum]|uniref:hypothetical protein n=1 Tax=Penicillium oxalicum TaxID=69781 RepID=UPI0020B884D1|nr:hypothetical protein POX_c04582 [Penicillium oxalicum]KAI2791710.1 hypothetical protein POX_c04582 [Penicillium oxalicum]
METTALGANATTISGLTGSDTASEDIPSETSDDRAFIVSDTDQLSYFSTDSSEASDSSLFQYDPSYNNIVDAPRDWMKLPIREITRKIVLEYGHEVEQYLVLWCYWETKTA